MLRRKLLMNLGPLVALFLLTAVTVIWLLQGVLRDMNHISDEAWQVAAKVNELSINVNAVEVDLYEQQLGKQRHLDTLIDRVESLHQLTDSLQNASVINEPAGRPSYQLIRERMPRFEHEVGVMATTQDPELASKYTEAALNTAVELRQATLPLSRHVRERANAEQEALLSWFRWVVLGMAMVFLLVVNVSVVVLLRLGSMILRPVDKLLQATRELSGEHFDYRVSIDQHDEFDELAHAYNSLAEQLQANEARRLETLAQAAIMMNHELNNAISIIDLQLKVLSRQTESAKCPALEKCFRQIQDSLQRVTRTVQSLKNVRRIVLTDYVPGTKMLDLGRSVAQDEPVPHAP